MHCLVTTIAELLPWILSWVACSCTSFASMEAEIVYALSIHGCRHTFKTSSLCRVASTYSLSALAYCILASLCVTETVYVAPFISSYLCFISRASVSRCSMFGSSCRVVRTSNDCSNSFMQSVTTLSTATIVVMIVVVRCSLTSSRVEGWTFNYNFAI